MAYDALRPQFEQTVLGNQMSAFWQSLAFLMETCSYNYLQLVFQIILGKKRITDRWQARARNVYLRLSSRTKCEKRVGNGTTWARPLIKRRIPVSATTKNLKDYAGKNFQQLSENWHMNEKTWKFKILQMNASTKAFLSKMLRKRLI